MWCVVPFTSVVVEYSLHAAKMYRNCYPPFDVATKESVSVLDGGEGPSRKLKHTKLEPTASPRKTNGTLTCTWF